MQNSWQTPVSETWWAILNLQASKGTDLLFSVGMFDYIKGQEGILPQSDANPPALSFQSYSSSQSCPALGWLLFLHWDLLCEDASPLVGFYVLVINFRPQLFQLSFNMSMSIILNLISYLYLVHFTLFSLLHCCPVFSKCLMQPYNILLLFSFFFTFIREIADFLPAQSLKKTSGIFFFGLV